MRKFWLSNLFKVAMRVFQSPPSWGGYLTNQLCMFLVFVFEIYYQWVIDFYKYHVQAKIWS
uniref:Uncharacterized protein n=1 Tax=Klebsiella pneumoniae TaxID=573 RepID=A0A8B0SS13_KLEPN|nr:hypothetical protein [Klebsiella pneumoniae]